MAVPTQASSGGALSEVLELILDRGLVIDAFVRVSLVGIEILTIDARVVVASVDTYLRFAEAIGRVNLDTRKAGVPELLAGRKAQSALEAAAETYGPALSKLLGEAAAEPAREEQR
jgi:hypothetical protein